MIKLSILVICVLVYVVCDKMQKSDEELIRRAH